MSDLIDRQAAIDKINERQRKLIYCFGFENDMVKIMDIAKSIVIALPSAQPDVEKMQDIEQAMLEKAYECGKRDATQWIPCSERLPEVEELVLVTDDSSGIKTVDVDRCGQYENSNERFWYYTQNVVAWMPLPKPYKEEQS